jgi:hypothetical protein
MADAPETLNQLSRRLKLPARWVRREAEAGRLPCLKVGDTFLFSPRAVDEALLKQAEGSTRASASEEACR